MADGQGPLDEFFEWFEEGRRLFREIRDEYDRKARRRKSREGPPGAPSRKGRRDNSPAPSNPGESPPGSAAVVLIDWISDRGWMVYFETASGVPLQKQRAVYELLKRLCGPESVSNRPSGGLVPFKTVDELSEALGISVPCLREQIRRLKRSLGTQSHFLESGPEGYRIRLRQGGQLIDRSSGDWDDRD